MNRGQQTSARACHIGGKVVGCSSLKWLLRPIGSESSIVVATGHLRSDATLAGTQELIVAYGYRSAGRWALAAALAALSSGWAGAQDGAGEAVPRESLEDAWWTGPLLAANASTLPRGHLYLEPYLFDSVPYAHFDAAGHAHATARANEFGSLSYVNYGLADRLTVGLIPRFGYDYPAVGASSSGIGVGDLTLQGQYRLTLFHPGSAVPTLSINVQQTLPTGRFDHLQRASDGLGAGADTTTISMFSQSFFWMPNGRLVRARLNLSYALSSQVTLEDQSVYGTVDGFRGTATPGDSIYVDLAFEYSLSRHWVAALDLWYQHDGSTAVSGAYATAPVTGGATAYASFSGSSREDILAPALEYNWSARLGVIVGARVIVAGRNVTATATPVAALSYFL
jgi:hypothetical protein